MNSDTATTHKPRVLFSAYCHGRASRSGRSGTAMVVCGGDGQEIQPDHVLRRGDKHTGYDCIGVYTIRYKDPRATSVSRRHGIYVLGLVRSGELISWDCYFYPTRGGKVLVGKSTVNRADYSDPNGRLDEESLLKSEKMRSQFAACTAAVKTELIGQLWLGIQRSLTLDGGSYTPPGLNEKVEMGAYSDEPRVLVQHDAVESVKAQEVASA